MLIKCILERCTTLISRKIGMRRLGHSENSSKTKRNKSLLSIILTIIGSHILQVMRTPIIDDLFIMVLRLFKPDSSFFLISIRISLNNLYDLINNMGRTRNPEIYVKGYGKSITKQDLKRWFKPFGKIICIQYKGPYSFIVQ